MDSVQSKTTFDELVSGISAEERSFLLSKLNRGKEPEVLVLQSSGEAASDGSYLDEKYKTEPFLYKLFLWLRSVLTKKNVEFSGIVVHHGKIRAEKISARLQLLQFLVKQGDKKLIALVNQSGMIAVYFPRKLGDKV